MSEPMTDAELAEVDDALIHGVRPVEWVRWCRRLRDEVRRLSTELATVEQAFEELATDIEEAADWAQRTLYPEIPAPRKAS